MRLMLYKILLLAITMHTYKIVEYYNIVHIESTNRTNIVDKSLFLQVTIITI